MKHTFKTVPAMLVLAAVVCAGAAADIVWTPGEGWRRSPGAAVGEKAADFDRAFSLYVAGAYRKAARVFKDIVKLSGEPLKEDASVLRAECLLGLKDYRRAFYAFENFAKSYPNSRHIDRALQGQLEIARVVLAGGKIKSLGLRIWPAYGLGEKVVDAIVARRPFSDQAAQAQIALARSYFRRHLYIESGSAYRQYAELFPNGPDVREALLGAGRSMLADARGSEYSPQPYYWTVMIAGNLARQFPDSPEADGAGRLAATASSALARHHFLVARWYLKRRKTDSALIYLRKVVREYPETEWAQRAGALVEKLAAAGGSDDGS